MSTEEMKRLEKGLLKLKGKVTRSKMHYWEKRQAYELIAKLARLMDLVGD